MQDLVCFDNLIVSNQYPIGYTNGNKEGAILFLAS